MTQIKQKLDAIVRGLKRCAVLEDVRFLREYATEHMETPIRGPLAVVGVTKITREKGCLGGYLANGVRGESYIVNAEICVYAPAEENGSGLSELVSELLMCLEQADEEHIITEAGASSIEFDAEVNAIFRRVALCLKFCVCEEE